MSAADLTIQLPEDFNNGDWLDDGWDDEWYEEEDWDWGAINDEEYADEE